MLECRTLFAGPRGSVRRFIEADHLGLDRAYSNGKDVATRPDLLYVLVRRKPKGYGHLVVYRVGEKTVDVLHVFHTAQDWQTMLIDEG